MYKIGEGSPCKGACEWFLTAEYDLDGKIGVECGADQESEIGEGRWSKEVGFIDDEESGEFVLAAAIEDLQEKPVFCALGGFTQLGDNESQQSSGGSCGKMKIEGAKAVLGKVLNEEPEQ